jgi:tetratricopeptide (TPR) repeat protein
VPYRRNTCFTGREAVLERLHAALQNGRDARIAVLSGLGGIGKTQTAVEYAYRFRDAYTAVLWTRADSAEELAQGLAQIAGQLGLAGAEAADRNVAVEATQRWLADAANSGWLLIADNADFIFPTWTPEAFEAFLPLRPTGSLLLTSRATAFDPLNVSSPILLMTMQPEEAILFLKHRVGRNEEMLPEGEQQALAQIVEHLGYLPLALEQAGAYIGIKQKSFAGYLSEYRRNTRKLLEEAKPKRGDYNRDPETREYHTVWTTWALNFQEVAEENPAAAELLRASAFLAPDAIPAELLLKAADQLGPTLAAAFAGADAETGWDRYDETLEPLTRYSLAQKDISGRTYTLHRLVQQVVRERLTEEERAVWRERMVRALCQAHPGYDFTSWAGCERLLPHWRVAAGYIQEDGLAFEEAGSLLNQMGYYLEERAQYREVELLFQQALAIRQQVLPEGDPDIAQSLSNLALLYKSQGRYEEAEPLYQQALAIRQHALPAVHPDFATSLSNLALLYYSQGRYEEAEPLYKQALTIQEQALPEVHPDIAQSLNNLALLYYSQGHYKEAEPLCQQALAIRQQVLPEVHPDIAQSLNNLALLYDSQGRSEDAEPLMKRALAIRQQVLPEVHPDIAQSLNNLAELYRSQGRYEEAEPLYKQAVGIMQEEPRAAHPNVAVVRANYAIVLEALGRVEAADAMRARAAAIREAHARQNEQRGGSS